MTDTAISKEPFPTWRIIVYSLGGIGTVLIGTLTGLMTYFYVPPLTSQSDFPVYLSSQTFLGLTFVGLIGFVGSLLTVFLGPLVASWSDRSRSPLGRRKTFMLVSFLPISVFSYLMFSPPVEGVSELNAGWLLAVVVLLNVARSFYNVNTALIPELGVSSRIIMLFQTVGAVTWLIGYVLGSQLVFVIKDVLIESGLSPVEAFRVTVGTMIALSTVLATLQVLVVDEKRYGLNLPSTVKMIPALRMAFKNRDFVLFTLTQQVYFWGDGLFQAGLVYFVTVLFGLPDSMMLAFGATIVLLSLVLYPLVTPLARRFGKKNLFLFALAMMFFIMLLFAFVASIPLPKLVLAWMIVALTAVPSAITGIIPGVILNEIVREDCVRSGNPNEASFGAAGGLITAIPAGLVGLVMPSMLLLGRSVDHPLGVQIVAVTSGVCMVLAGILLAIFYREKKILESLQKYGYQ